MTENFNNHLGNKLKMRRLALGLTQTKVARAISVTFQQIQKYEKGINGVSAQRLMQLSNFLKVPVSYFFDDFTEYLNAKNSSNPSLEENNLPTVNYDFLMKIYTELSVDQKNKFKKLLLDSNNLTKTG